MDCVPLVKKIVVYVEHSTAKGCYNSIIYHHHHHHHLGQYHLLHTRIVQQLQEKRGSRHPYHNEQNRTD